MTNAQTQTRTPRGVPAGGRFTAAEQSAPDIDLGPTEVTPDNAAEIARAERFVEQLEGGYLAAHYAPNGRPTPAFGTYDSRHGRVLITADSTGVVRASLDGRPYNPDALQRWRDRRLRRWIETAMTGSDLLTDIARAA